MHGEYKVPGGKLVVVDLEIVEGRIADFQLASMATDWREAHMPLADFAGITRWLDRLQALPAWADPWPSTN